MPILLVLFNPGIRFELCHLTCQKPGSCQENEMPSYFKQICDVRFQ